MLGNGPCNTWHDGIKLRQPSSYKIFFRASLFEVHHDKIEHITSFFVTIVAVNNIKNIGNLNVSYCVGEHLTATLILYTLPHIRPFSQLATWNFTPTTMRSGLDQLAEASLLNTTVRDIQQLFGTAWRGWIITSHEVAKPCDTTGYPFTRGSLAQFNH